MSNIGDVIKELAVNAVEAQKPVEVVIGRVIDDENLKIRLEQRLTIDKSVIDLCRDINIGVDDTVVMLRYNRGQRYLVINAIE